MKKYFVLFILFTASCNTIKLSQDEIDRIKVHYPEKRILGELPMNIIFTNVQYFKQKKIISVTGKVIDAKTKENISSVSIIVSQGGHKKVVTSSNAQGEFHFTTLFDKRDTLIFDLPGYRNCLYSYFNFFTSTHKQKIEKPQQ